MARWRLQAVPYNAIEQGPGWVRIAAGDCETYPPSQAFRDAAQALDMGEDCKAVAVRLRGLIDGLESGAAKALQKRLKIKVCDQLTALHACTHSHMCTACFSDRLAERDPAVDF